MFSLAVKICSLFKMSAWGGKKRVLTFPPSINIVIVFGSSQTPPNSRQRVATIYEGITRVVINYFTNYKCKFFLIYHIYFLHIYHMQRMVLLSCEVAPGFCSNSKGVVDMSSWKEFFAAKDVQVAKNR